MATRTPTSILLLIDRRNRLEGELRKLAGLKRAVSELHHHVKSELSAASAALDKKSGRFDEDTEDAVADLGPVVIRGRENLRPILRDRYAKYTHFDLEKKLPVVSGDVIVCDVRLRWKSADEPRLQHTRALEILQVRDGRIARWDNASISWIDAKD